jgi:hypothetical protein
MEMRRDPATDALDTDASAKRLQPDAPASQVRASSTQLVLDHALDTASRARAHLDDLEIKLAHLRKLVPPAPPKHKG